jgi:hypothetical protein
MWFGVTVWNERAVVGGRAGPSRVGRPGGALLGPEKSGGLTGWWVFAGFFVVVWLLDSGREHLCSCFAQIISLCGGGLFLLCLCVWRQAMKGVWWMPWHQEPMKDVGACDKPWGVGNRAVIRGCPNGETWLESCPVTCI